MRSSLLVGLLLLTETLTSPLANKSAVVVVTETVTTSVIDSASDIPWKHVMEPVTVFPDFAYTELSSIGTSVPSKSLPPIETLTFSVGKSSSSTAAASSSTSTLDSYSRPILDQHNIHRANSSALALTWSSGLASIAAQIASSCVYAENTEVGGGGFGQNIGAGAEPAAVPALITNRMYNDEIEWYPTPYGNDSPDLSNFEKWGHYSQIVWKATTSVGCATQYCPSGLANTGPGISPYFTVCNYSPAGNVNGEYRNVGAPDGGIPSQIMG